MHDLTNPAACSSSLSSIIVLGRASESLSNQEVLGPYTYWYPGCLELQLAVFSVCCFETERDDILIFDI